MSTTNLKKPNVPKTTNATPTAPAGAEDKISNASSSGTADGNGDKKGEFCFGDSYLQNFVGN